jgi:hypothetical protein
MCLCKVVGILSRSESHTGPCLVWLLSDLFYHVRYFLSTV